MLKKKALNDRDNMAYKPIIAVSLSQMKMTDLYSESWWVQHEKQCIYYTDVYWSNDFSLPKQIQMAQGIQTTRN